MTFAHRAVAAAQQLDGADPASQVFGFGAILVLAGRAAHLEAVMRPLAGAEQLITSGSARIVDLVSEGPCHPTLPAVDRSVEAVAWGR